MNKKENNARISMTIMIILVPILVILAVGKLWGLFQVCLIIEFVFVVESVAKYFRWYKKGKNK